MLSKFECAKRIIFKPINWKLQRMFSSESEQKLSYYHQLGDEPIKYMTIGQMLKRAATKFPDTNALISHSENLQITFAETLDRADRLASGLLDLGLEKGDRVALWAPSHEFWYVSKMALVRSGLICVAVNPAYQLPELAYSLKKVDVKAIIIPEVFRTQKYYEMLDTLLPSLKHSGREIKDNEVNSVKNVIVYSEKSFPGAIKYSDLLKSSDSDAAAIEKLQTSISPDAGCNIQFTSGTTGHPKAALVNHLGFVNNGFDSGVRHEFTKGHHTICNNFPFFHVAGIITMMSAMAFGSTLVMPALHFNPEVSLKALVEHKCNGIYGTPGMYVDMIATQKKLKLELPANRFACTGAAICTPKLVSDIKKHLQVKRLESMYGMTETSACGFQSMPDEDEKLVEDFVGKAENNLEFKVIDKEGNLVPFGQPGELCIRGYCTMLGYWQDEKKTKEVLGDDKWLKTGDQFILYENGYAKIVGRLKEMIIRGGENLFPREIEDFLNTHPNILETHVIGIPDERMGEEVGAFIKRKDNSLPLTQEDIKRFCKGKLSHFKVPRYVFIVDNFPKTTSGKVQKVKFFEHFAEEIKRSV